MKSNVSLQPNLKYNWLIRLVKWICNVWYWENEMSEMHYYLLFTFWLYFTTSSFALSISPVSEMFVCIGQSFCTVAHILPFNLFLLIPTFVWEVAYCVCTSVCVRVCVCVCVCVCLTDVFTALSGQGHCCLWFVRYKDCRNLSPSFRH